MSGWFSARKVRAASAALLLWLCTSFALCGTAIAQDGLIASAERGETLVVRRLLAEGDNVLNLSHI
jgi:hypothetical protein